jgi:hypothetical protein
MKGYPDDQFHPEGLPATRSVSTTIGSCTGAHAVVGGIGHRYPHLVPLPFGLHEANAPAELEPALRPWCLDETADALIAHSS